MARARCGSGRRATNARTRPPSCRTLSNASRRPWPASFTFRPSPDEPPFVAVGPDSRSRRHPVRHRGDEGLQRRHRRARWHRRSRARHARATRSRPASPPADRVSADVQHRPDRQPRRDRAAHPARLPALGLRTIAVHSEADRDAPHVRQADLAPCASARPGSAELSRPGGDPCSPPRPPAQRRSIRATAFCPRTPPSPSASRDAGLTFIGPSAACIRTMGDKVAAKRAMRAAGVPCVPGPDEPLPDDPEAMQADRRARSAIRSSSRRPAAAAGAACASSRARSASPRRSRSTREEARRAFGNPEIYVEKFLAIPAMWRSRCSPTPRPCALARQPRLLAAAPPPEGARGGAGAGSARRLVAEVGERCAEACRQIGYQGVGTFEFLVEDGAFFFIEMNTRRAGRASGDRDDDRHRHRGRRHPGRAGARR